MVKKVNGGNSCNPNLLIAGLIPQIKTTNNDKNMADSFIKTFLKYLNHQQI